MPEANVEPFRVIITGSRDWHCWRMARNIVDGLWKRHGDALLIVHGDCQTGVDAAFRAACKLLGVAQEPHPADWATHGKAAGPIRNREMAEAGAQHALAFHPNLMGSRGTLDCVRQCLKAGIPVWLIEREGEAPVRIRSLEGGRLRPPVNDERP